MPMLKFKIQGLINSIRIPQTAAYQNTELTPKKTHIAGMLTNIMGKDERFYYKELLPNILVGIVPVTLENLFTDFWRFDKWSQNILGGKGTVKREKLYKPEYLVYIKTENKNLFNEINISLKLEKRVPSLGMDDELILIQTIKQIDETYLPSEDEADIHSIFPYENVGNYKFYKYKGRNKLIIPPRTINTNLIFEFDEGNPPRKPKNFVNIIEFIGGFCKVKFVREYPYNIISDGNINVVLW